MRDRGSIESYITHIVSCRKNSTFIDPKVQQWLTEISGSPVSTRLAKWGLIADSGIATLGAFTDWFFKQKSEVWKDVDGNPVRSPSTVRTNNTTKNYLIQFFGIDRELQSITRGDADDFVQWLRSGATRSKRKTSISKHIKITRNWFNYVWRKQWTRENPFDHIPYAAQVDRDRICHMTTDEATRVIEELTSNQQRLFFALGRYAGLRMPSEVAGLKWSHIVFDKSTLSIIKVKTKARTMPLWPEVMKLAWEEFKEWQDSDRKDEFVIYQHRVPHQDGGTTISGHMVKQLKAAYERAGIKDFEKATQNLRTSCENDLRLILTEGQLTEFMGHSTKVAQLHYRKTTAQEFKKLADIKRDTPLVEVMEARIEATIPSPRILE